MNKLCKIAHLYLSRYDRSIRAEDIVDKVGNILGKSLWILKDRNILKNVPITAHDLILIMPYFICRPVCKFMPIYKYMAIFLSKSVRKKCILIAYLGKKYNYDSVFDGDFFKYSNKMNNEEIRDIAIHITQYLTEDEYNSLYNSIIPCTFSSEIIKEPRSRFAMNFIFFALSKSGMFEKEFIGDLIASVRLMMFPQQQSYLSEPQ